MKYYIIGIIIVGIVLSVLFALLRYLNGRKYKKKHNDSSTITVRKNISSNQNSQYPIKMFEPDPSISEYFEELNQIKALYTQRETNPDALQQCINLCYLNINSFPMVLEAMNYDVPISTPAFERLSIILEKGQCFTDAWEIAQIQAFFNPTEQNVKRVNRLSNKIYNTEDKSSGNIKLDYHYDEIKSLQGSLSDKVDKIFEIIRKSKFKFDLMNEFVDDYVVLDVETTGLNYHYDAIVEIGCIRFRNNKEIARFNTLINPNIPIPAPATEIHNITDEMVKDAPYIDEKLQDLLNFIGDDVVIGHNIGFDIRFVINACLWEFLPYQKFKAIDTLALARKYISKKDITDYSLDTIRQFLHIDQPAHRALNDCCASAKLYQYCMNLNNQEQQHT